MKTQGSSSDLVWWYPYHSMASTNQGFFYFIASQSLIGGSYHHTDISTNRKKGFFKDTFHKLKYTLLHTSHWTELCQITTKEDEECNLNTLWVSIIITFHLQMKIKRNERICLSSRKLLEKVRIGIQNQASSTTLLFTYLLACT